MKKFTLLTTSILLTLVLSACFAIQEAPESSGAVEAPTLAVDPTEVVEEPTNEPAPEPTAEPEPTSEPEPTDAAEEEVEEEMEESAEDADTDDAMAEDAAAGPVVFTIDPARSEARFKIDEVLRGSDVTVVGVTNNLGGQLSVDMADLTSAQVGEILINARDIVTDNDFRNRAIANRILESEAFEFISFVPTSIAGLEAATIGAASDFQLTGDLTIKDQTREVTFDMTVTPTSATELEGFGSAVILYADFGLEIPFSQAVDSVEDEVTLELDFVASASN